MDGEPPSIVQVAVFRAYPKVAQLGRQAGGEAHRPIRKRRPTARLATRNLPGPIRRPIPPAHASNLEEKAGPLPWQPERK